MQELCKKDDFNRSVFGDFLFLITMIADFMEDFQVLDESKLILRIAESKWNALTAALILGLIEGCWHIPLVFMSGDQRFGMLIPVLIFPYFATGVIRAWIFNNTNGSVLAAVLFHAAGNTAGEIIPVNVPSQTFADLIYTGLAVIIVLVFGAKDLVRTKSFFQPKDKNNTVSQRKAI